MTSFLYCVLMLLPCPKTPTQACPAPFPIFFVLHTPSSMKSSAACPPVFKHWPNSLPAAVIGHIVGRCQARADAGWISPSSWRCRTQSLTDAVDGAKRLGRWNRRLSCQLHQHLRPKSDGSCGHVSTLTISLGLSPHQNWWHVASWNV